MKIWIKLLLSILIGVGISFALPDSSVSVLDWLVRFALNIGRYTVAPILVFSLTISVYRLRQDDKFWRMVLKNLIVIICLSAAVILIGIVTTLVYSPGRIPIEMAEQHEAISLNPAQSVMELFPANMLSVLSGDGVYLFPLCVFAFFLGIGLNYDRNYTKPVISMIDSLSRVFYHIASFFTEILGFILIVLVSYWAVRFGAVWRNKVFRDIIIMLGALSIVFCFGVLPMLLYFVRPKVNPWKVFYGFIGPAITAFFSGDINFTFPVLMRHLKENFGVRRRSSALSLGLCTAFCRGGSGMVAAAAFIVIIKSYTYIHITMFNALLIGLYAFGISFILARRPGDGAFAALSVLCLRYGGGEYRAGFLILQPIAFYLITIGAFVDIMLGAFCSYLVAKTSGLVEEKNLVHFI
jgi:Na+/H+-dicarboxylate symporter